MRNKINLTSMLVIFLLVVIGAFATWQISKSRTFQFFGGIVRDVDTKEKVVALTFDDGPSHNTGEVLKILNELNVKATFFVTGSELNQNLDEGKEIVSAGHELGNHSFSHKRMVFKSPSFIEKEIEKTDELIREAGYKGDIHFRPPNGKKLLFLPYYLKQKNKKTVLWDIEPESFSEIGGSSEKIVDYIIGKVKPGSIILLHIMYDSRKESVASLKGIVNVLREKGYTFTTVSELIKLDEKS